MHSFTIIIDVSCIVIDFVSLLYYSRVLPQTLSLLPLFLNVYRGIQPWWFVWFLPSSLSPQSWVSVPSWESRIWNDERPIRSSASLMFTNYTSKFQKKKHRHLSMRWVGSAMSPRLWSRLWRRSTRCLTSRRHQQSSLHPLQRVTGSLSRLPPLLRISISIWTSWQVFVVINGIFSCANKGGPCSPQSSELSWKAR